MLHPKVTNIHPPYLFFPNFLPNGARGHKPVATVLRVGYDLVEIGHWIASTGMLSREKCMVTLTLSE